MPVHLVVSVEPCHYLMSFLGEEYWAECAYDSEVDKWIICTEALWVSCGTWLGFWSGVIGALVAAIIGGLVALLVVRLTNSQQRRGVERTVEIAALADCVAAME